MNSIHQIIWATLLFISIATNAQSQDYPNQRFGEPSGLPLPSTLPLVDYEKKLYPWIGNYNYKNLAWAVDKGVRDTGPFIEGKSYGTHSAVRIFYSPEMMEWLTNGRDRGDPIANGAMIIKEMYVSPAAIYTELANDPNFADKSKYENMLESVITSWVVMVKDDKLAHDGWFWGSVEIPAPGETLEHAIEHTMLDTAINRGVTQLRWSGTAMPCMRCHASAEKELTFSDLANIEGYDEESPLIFRVDDSWRTPEYFNNLPLCNIKNEDYVTRFMYMGSDRTPTSDDCPPKKKTATDEAAAAQTIDLSDHSLRNNVAYTVPSKPNTKANPLFLSTFDSIPATTLNKANLEQWTFPPEWMDHAVMPADHLTEYITSDNCLGCHGGLAGSPNRDVMFIPPVDPKKQGYNVSEYGEWRWSPMGLAGRDPIFHSQLESEMALLERDNKLDMKHPENKLLLAPLKETAQAVTNKCLTCHGAMGERQLKIDAAAAHKSDADSTLDRNFKMEYFYLPEILTKADEKQQQKDKTADYVKYGALAREGISCMICHRIDAPDPAKVESWQPVEKGWITSTTDKTLAYNLFHHSSGEFRKGPIDQVFGPFDVAQKPMQHSFDLTPLQNDYISDSQMCGNCHTINLPNIGSNDTSQPVLAAAAEPAFKGYPHSIEQATFVEWQNSVFSVEPKANSDKSTFKSCQDCHMPSGFKSIDGTVETVDPLITQIASIQDTSYPEVGNSLPNDEIDIPVRDNYKRHTHVGLNVFLLSMIDQFSDLLGLYKTDYMTGVDNGIDLALDSMIQQAQDSTAKISVEVPTAAKQVIKKGVIGTQVTADVSVANLTGHRYPSGVAFRRAFLELSVTDDAGNILWQSGGTNDIGVILDGHNGPVLDTEFLPNDLDGLNLKLPSLRPSEKECLSLLSKNNIHYQPHYQTITEQSQVQIYEELNLNAQCGFTTSFVHRVHPIKDNRLLPRGWRESKFFASQGEVMREFMHATDPEGNATKDIDYASGDNLDFAGVDNLKYQVFIPGSYKGPLNVTVTLYNQSIPPYWLKHRFDEAPKGRATRRLHYMASHLDLDKTAMQDWKLKLVSASAVVPN